MLDSRESKLNGIVKVVSNVEDKVMAIIKKSTNSLTKAKFYEVKFKNGPHLQNHGHKEPDFFYPKKEDLNYDNYIVGFVHNSKANQFRGVNVIMSNGEQSDLPLLYNGGTDYETVLMDPPDAVVKRVVMRGNYEFAGV